MLANHQKRTSVSELFEVRPFFVQDSPMCVLLAEQDSSESGNQGVFWAECDCTCMCVCPCICTCPAEAKK